MSSIRDILLSGPMFGITLSIVVYVICSILYRKTKAAFLNPLLLTIIIISGILLIFGIEYDVYNAGGQFITLLLSPATVALAVPLYDQFELIKRNASVILVSISVGTLASILSIFALCKAFGLDDLLTMSLIPKSVTTAIAIGVSSSLGGIKAITVVAVLLSGVLGASAGPLICRALRIKSHVAVGLAMGTASHAIGTSKAIELGEDEGAMSSLAITVAGIVTVIAAPPLVAVLMGVWG